MGITVHVEVTFTDIGVVIMLEATDVVVVDDIIVIELDDVVVLVGSVDNVVVDVIDVASVK